MKLVSTAFSAPSLIEIFPGQGAQAVGMVADLIEQDAATSKLVTRAERRLGRPLTNLILRGPRASLARTDIQQPAICLATALCLDAACRAGLPRAAIVAGHSLGELSAAHAAGAMDAETLVELADRRGRAMAAAAEASPGGMAAVAGADAATIAELIEEAGRAGEITLANRNSPLQSVLSGSENALARCSELCRARGLRWTRLEVTGPWHSPAMRPAAERFASALESAQLNDPEVPIVSALESVPIRDAGTLRRVLVRQIIEPADWLATVGLLDLACPTGVLVEVGPGRILSGLMLALAPHRTTLRISDRKTLSATLNFLQAASGQDDRKGTKVAAVQIDASCRRDPGHGLH